MDNVDDLFLAFGGAAQLGRVMGKSTEHAFTMKRRRSVPTKYWPSLLRSAARFGVTLTEADLLRIHINVDATPAPKEAGSSFQDAAL